MSDIYVIVHIATTCDDTTTYVTKDSSELIEFAWETLDTSTLERCRRVHFGSSNQHPDYSILLTAPQDIVGTCQERWIFKDAITKFDQYEFSIVVYDTPKLRVQLSREARDKSVVLPSYLQHPRVFDIPKEYCNWQSTHAEALSYPPTSLSNIITALDLDVDNVADYAELPNFSSSTPPPRTPADDPNAAVVDLHTLIVKQLIKKSIPIEDHPAVFTKPYDSGRDITVFSAERSKVLYLSNLPNDTTQSELESWFTQYGGRPGGFWTFKNGDEPNSSGNNTMSPKTGISGFVAFATHDEAADCLALNGRVLGDRAIEFSILLWTNYYYPVPVVKEQTKARGLDLSFMWVLQLPEKNPCFRCSFSAVAFQDLYNHANIAMQTIYRVGHQTRTPPLLGSSSSSNNNNITTKCTNSNNATAQQVQQPQLQQVQQVAHTDKVPSNNNGLGYNGLNDGSVGLQNYANDSNVAKSMPEAIMAGDWKCEICMYHNFAKNLCCLKCGVAKPIVNNQQPNPIHSVNTTAAAIAAATASGQPLNLNNAAFLGLQQSQAQHHYNQQRRNNNSIPGGQNFNNSNNNNQKTQYYNNNNNLRSGLTLQNAGITPQAMMYSPTNNQQAGGCK
ncbi:putative RNA-binding protein C17H9.04c [Candida viswanathii]|uniref:Putative RNA-binding protein C17H9.04c n=1 Tax=Candida viswanathii TaxID=5486 RepID=A0A367XS32_9ASCO|nr:putative RNA-binding protein C17H9.04c [Candida viswanathii]